MSALTSLLDPRGLARLAHLQVLARTTVEGFCSGLHRSPHKGFSVEFREHRAYVPGDEIRYLDWKIFARRDRFYIREYEEETNVRATLLLDASGSMGYGSGEGTKFDYAVKLAACLSYLLLRQADAVGLAAGRVDIMLPLLKDWDFDALITHNRFTLVNRNAEEMMDYATAKGIAVLNAAPYAGGVLAKGSATHKRYVYQVASAETLEPVARVERICAKHGIPPGAAALQFSVRDPRVASTVCGVSKPERITQTIEWARFPIPQAAWDELMALPYEAGDPEATRVYSPG